MILIGNDHLSMVMGLKRTKSTRVGVILEDNGNDGGMMVVAAVAAVGMIDDNPYSHQVIKYQFVVGR